MGKLQSIEMEGGTTADTSYGITELPNVCKWKEGGSVNGAKDVRAKTRRERKAKSRLKKEREEEKENGRMEKVEKMAHEVLSGSQVDHQPKKTRGRQRRLFTITMCGLVWH